MIICLAHPIVDKFKNTQAGFSKKGPQRSPGNNTAKPFHVISSQGVWKQKKSLVVDR